MPGTVKLIYKDELIALRNYDCIAERKRVIAYWKSLYAAKFARCAIQIKPDLDPRKLREQKLKAVMYD